MSEAQAFIALPTFLADPAESQFRTNHAGESRNGGITCWSEAIKYLLWTYETASVMNEVIEDLRNVKPKLDVKEDAYRKRLDPVIFR